MSITERASDRLASITEEVARAIARHGIRKGDPGSAKGTLRVELERNVRRTVQVYWTGFQANVPGRSVGLHLEVAEPRVHWSEAYLSPASTSWVFCFAERPDGDIQLTYYRDYPTPEEGLEGFFNLSAWYVLTACDISWSEVTFSVADALAWEDRHEAMSGAQTNTAVDESLKKSSIVWLRWTDDSGDHTMPVWYVNDKTTLYVLSGERQQAIPGAENIRRCDVIFRNKGKNWRVGEVPASVRVLEKGPEWDTIAEKIAEKRLNIPGLPEDTAARWRDECVILELTLHLPF